MGFGFVGSDLGLREILARRGGLIGFFEGKRGLDDERANGRGGDADGLEEVVVIVADNGGIRDAACFDDFFAQELGRHIGDQVGANFNGIVDASEALAGGISAAD